MLSGYSQSATLLARVFDTLTLMMLNKNNEYIPIRIMTNALFYVKICSKNWEDYLHEQTRNGA